MAKARTAWGIDVGQCALKALQLRDLGGQVQVESFAAIEHPHILSEPEANRDQLIREALEKFLSRHSVVGSRVAISVPGQTGFARFVKLPPVESKRIPDIVRFEAEQQIPFPIADVIWRWQTFADPNSPDKEVGIFAMKRLDVSSMLSHFTDVALPVDVVQMAPLALYNFLIHDGRAAEGGATLLADIGADKTDLIVSDGPRIWTRTVQIGGNSFTHALVKAFKLSFRKAEKLKRTAASSKYARQIFQAMRPVFADLVQEIQRSIGYYTSLHRETRFKQVVGMGNGFRLPGIQKFLEQNLNLKVLRIDSYSKLTTGPGVNAAKFNENVLSLGVAYGLAVQGLGLSTVNTNLLPSEIARVRRWKKKQPWFAAAGGVLLLTMGTMLYSVRADIQKLHSTQGQLAEAKQYVQQVKQWQSQYNQWKNQGGEEKEFIDSTFELLAYRNFWPSFQAALSESVLRVTGPDQELLMQYVRVSNAGEGQDQQEQILEKIKSIPRSERQQIFIERMDYQYAPDVNALLDGGTGAAANPARSQRGYSITLTGRTPLPLSRTNQLIDSLLETLRTVSNEKYPPLAVLDADVEDIGTYRGDGGRSSRSLQRTVSDWDRRGNQRTRGGDDWGANAPGGDWGRPAQRAQARPRGQEQQIENPDPLLPDESMVQDTQFTIKLVVGIQSDGVQPVMPTDATSP